MITDYYKPGFTLYRKVKSKNANGVWGYDEVLIKEFRGVLDKKETEFEFSSDNENYRMRYTLFCGVDVGIREDDIIHYNSKEYEVDSVVDPLQRYHHVESILKRRE